MTDRHRVRRCAMDVTHDWTAGQIDDGAALHVDANRVVVLTGNGPGKFVIDRNSTCRR